MALHLLGIDGEAGKVPQQLAAFGEAGRRRHADHAQGARRERGSLEPKRAVARSEAAVAAVAVIPGALQGDGAERRGDRLGPAAGVASLSAAWAGQSRPPFVGTVAVEAVRHGSAHDP